MQWFDDRRIPVLRGGPAPVERACLTGPARTGDHCAARPDLRRRVTVAATDALGVDLPARLGAVLAMNMIGHLDAQERRTFLRRVAERLVPDAPLVLNVQPPSEPTTVPFMVFGTVPLGRHRYEGGGSAEPSGPDSVTWRMRYRLLATEGTVLREDHAAYRWHVIPAAELLAELAEAGLTGEVGPQDVVRAVRRS